MSLIHLPAIKFCLSRNYVKQTDRQRKPTFSTVYNAEREVTALFQPNKQHT